MLQPTEQFKPMNKSKQKNSENWNVEILKALALKYNFSTRYIKQCITGDRTPIFADRIKSEYKSMEKQVNTILNNDAL